MAVDLMVGFGQTAAGERFPAEKVEDEASAGIESVEKLLRLLSQTQYQPENFSGSESKLDADIDAVTGAAVDKFKKVISLLDRTRTGHARFRKAPLVLQTSSPQQVKTEPEPKPKPKPSPSSAFRIYSPNPVQRFPPPTITASPSFSAATSFVSSLTGDTESVQPSISSGFQFSQRTTSFGKPPLSLKRKCSSVNDAALKCGSASGRCHCHKKRKSRTKRTIRVPAISLKLADIPADEFSWRKYGQKPIKGSPHPRGYYKCSSVRGCPARKHVERARDDPAMLIVTYEDDHSHTAAPESSK